LPDGSALVRALAMKVGDGPPHGCAPAIQHTFVIAKEACRLRQSKGRQGSDGSPCRCAPAIQHTFVIAKEGCRLRQSKGLEGSDGSPRRFAPRDDNRWGEEFMGSITHRLCVGRALAMTVKKEWPPRFAPAIQHTFVIAKEACRLRQSKGLEGSDGSPRRCAPRDDNRGKVHCY